jgi:predicted dehydrogenase
VERALRTTQYGKCVFRCDNNVVEHQVVNLEFEGGVTATFSMCAFSQGGRDLRIMGTKGVLYGRPGAETVTLYDFAARKETEISVNDKILDETLVGGHGGGDTGIVSAFYDLLTGVPNFSVCDISESVANHMIAFAAEESRLSGTVVDVAAYTASVRRAAEATDEKE